jgi:hypothetical protein
LQRRGRRRRHNWRKKFGPAGEHLASRPLSPPETLDGLFGPPRRTCLFGQSTHPQSLQRDVSGAVAGSRPATVLALELLGEREVGLVRPGHVTRVVVCMSSLSPNLLLDPDG